MEQDPNDESALNLHRDIKEQESKLPFNVPANWLVIRMEMLARKLGAGSTPLGGKSVYQDEGIPFLRSQNVHNSGLKLDDVARIPQDTHERMSGTHIQENDILLNITGASIGRCALVPSGFGEGNVSQHVAIIRLVNPLIREFVHLSLISPPYQKLIMDVQVGVSREGLSMQRLKRFPILVPPLAEQHRIVAKVDELMALCDELEAAQTKRETQRDHLVAATLHRLNNSDSAPSAFEETARFYFNHLPRLTTRPKHIKQLRQTILNLAVRGKLVPQNSSDEAASELLKRIAIQKLTYMQLGQIRKEKNLIFHDTEDKVFRIPSNWTWVKVGNLAFSTDYGTSQKSIEIDDGTPVLTMGAIQNGLVRLSNHKKVPSSIDDLPALLLHKLDLLYNRTNSAELVGKTGIFLGEDDRFTFASYLIRLRFIAEFTNAHYVNLAMNAPYFRTTQVVPHLKQQCGQANVNGTKLKNMLIPLPPLAEQHRIVAKVDELMAVCAELETQLTTATNTRRALLEATLQEALSSDLKANREASALADSNLTVA